MIVCMGDSITTGQGTDVAWPSLLGRPVIARGRPGDTTRLALERFPDDLQSLEPDVVIIQFGHNDANRWETDRGLPRVSERSFEANLHEMIERARTFGATPYLLSLTPSFRSARHALDTIRYDAIIRRVAEAEGVPLIDVSHEITRAHLQPDGIHLTAEGHRLYASVVRTALGNALEAVG